MRIPGPSLPVPVPVPDPATPEVAVGTTSTIGGAVTIVNTETPTYALAFSETTMTGGGFDADSVRVLRYGVTTSPQGGLAAVQAHKLYTRRCTDFWGITFLPDVQAVSSVDAGYAAVVKTRNAPVAVFSSGGMVHAVTARYRVDDWIGATVQAAPDINGLVMSACTPTPGVILALIRVEANKSLYCISSMDQGATWWWPSTDPIAPLIGTRCPNAARILVNDEPFGHVVLCYIDPATGFPAHKVTRNLGTSWA